ncbi:MAG TPA: hypothetical protein VIR03_02410 [Candidatus Saccharimonadales bacterium]
MRTPESVPTLTDLIGDASILEIIEDRLLPSDYEGAMTRKYFVDGLPEVVIRHTPGEPEPSIRDVVATAFSQLPEHGIVALPYLPVEHQGEIYVVTRKVHGVSLEQMATPDASDSLVRGIDSQWANMFAYVRDGRAEGFACAGEIIGLGQHMYGRTSVDTSDRIRLVDLGQSAINYAEYPGSAEYERALIRLASEVVEVESALGRPDQLRLSRAVLDQAIDLGERSLGGRKSEELRRIFIDAAKYVLAERVTLDPDDDENFF